LNSEPNDFEPLPLSLLNDFLFCQRRAALKGIEGLRSENSHTVRGDIVHEHADLPGYEVAKGVKLLRALPVFSDRLGLNGKCDIVETDCPISAPSQGGTEPAEKHSTPGGLRPVEYKKGKRRQFENDDAQLCAQALCLEEMFGLEVRRGAVFHAGSKRRREVVFTQELRKMTEDAVGALHELIRGGVVPPAVFKPACEECSLFQICLPKAGSQAAGLGRKLFEP
jgi:CRISPR-associated exonuclease Cas4